MPERFRLARSRSEAMREREVDAELQFHIDERIEELVASGVSRADAEREVRARFGDVATVRAELQAIDATIDRKQSRGERLTAVAHQARLAMRSLVRRRTFALVAIATLALGTGAATSVFTLVEGILLRPLPFTEADRLVEISNTAMLSGRPLEAHQSDAIFLFFQEHNTLLENIAVYRTMDLNVAMPSSDGTADGNAERMPAASVSASLFPTLGVQAAQGRLFLPGEDRVAAPRVMVVSDAFWRRKLGSASNAIGRVLMVHGEPRELVGILPPSFSFPSPDIHIFVPNAFDRTKASAADFSFRSIGRLKDGVSMERANAELDRLLLAVLDEFPGDVPPEMWKAAHVRAKLMPLRDAIVGDVRQLLWILLGSAAVVLVIACANVASLFMVRAEEGHHELAVRRALGAGGTAAASQYVAEASLIALGGGVMGVVLTTLAVRGLRFLPSGIDLPRLQEVAIAWPSLIFAMAIAMLCTVAVSVFPVVRSRNVSVAAVLKDAARSSTGGVSRQRARSALVVAQVALAMVLVTSSGLMARSFMRLRNVSPGFDASHALVVRVALSSANYHDAQSIARFHSRLLQGVRELAGVEQVGLTTWVPLSLDADEGAASVEGQEVLPNEVPPVHPYVYASDSLFRALGVPILEGRAFAPIDPTRESDEVMVSQAFARRYWPGQSAIGKRVRQGIQGEWQTVIGVLGDVHLAGLDRPAEEALYIPLLSRDRGHPGVVSSPREVALIVRVVGDPSALLPSVRAVVRRIDPSLPTFGEKPLSEMVGAAAARTRFTMLLLGVASAVALLLGAVGLYGVLAYAVSLRHREIGVRMALGARPSDVRWMVSRQGIVLAGGGVIIGLLVSLGATRLLQGLLYGVSPSDPLTMGVTCVVLLCVALLASWLPARRAAALPPVAALRGD